MQLQEEYQENSTSITHSPYYGCTVRVVSKANVSYEGILDGISVNKDRIFLKNVRVKGNINDSSDRIISFEESDTLNSVMIDHLTNDMHVYEQVCLNVRDIKELKLIRLPASFHESQAKLYAIDPCLVDIRLSPTDEQQRLSNESLDSEPLPPPPPIARRSRGESFGSNGGSASLISSSSNESSSSFTYRPIPHSHHKSINDQIHKFNRLSLTTPPPTNSTRPVTLLAKKVLPKKIERSNNNIRPLLTQNQYDSTQIHQSNTIKKSSSDNNRKSSPIRVTITSNLNPNAIPFYAPPPQQQQRSIPSNQNSSFTFYERKRFQPRLQPVVSPDRSQIINPVLQQQQQQPQTNPSRSHQRFIPPRQMALKKNFNNQQSKPKTSSHEQIPRLMQQTSSTIMDQILSTPPMRERLSVPNNKRPRPTSAVLSSTTSLPYQNRNSGDFNQYQNPLVFGENLGSHRGQRTISGTSSGSSLSVDIGPHSIVQYDSTSSVLTSSDSQYDYDFEKANQEFRRYLELEELVTRRASSVCSIGSYPDDSNNNGNSSQPHSYKKEMSFFDRISCTATTGTAVAYTEMDEVEKNLETFGDAALLINSELNDNEWQL